MHVKSIHFNFNGTTDCLDYLNSNKISLFINCLTCFGADETNGAFHILNATNIRCEWIWRFYFNYFIGGAVFLAIIPAIASGVFSFLKGQSFDANHLYHPLKLMWVERVLRECILWFRCNLYFITLLNRICKFYAFFLPVFHGIKAHQLDIALKYLISRLQH